jgi:hypothetical protein
MRSRSIIIALIHAAGNTPLRARLLKQMAETQPFGTTWPLAMGLVKALCQPTEGTTMTVASGIALFEFVHSLNPAEVVFVGAGGAGFETILHGLYCGWCKHTHRSPLTWTFTSLGSDGVCPHCDFDAPPDNSKLTFIGANVKTSCWNCAVNSAAHGSAVLAVRPPPLDDYRTGIAAALAANEAALFAYFGEAPTRGSPPEEFNETHKRYNSLAGIAAHAQLSTCNQQQSDAGIADMTELREDHSYNLAFAGEQMLDVEAQGEIERGWLAYGHPSANLPTVEIPGLSPRLLDSYIDGFEPHTILMSTFARLLGPVDRRTFTPQAAVGLIGPFTDRTFYGRVGTVALTQTRVKAGLLAVELDGKTVAISPTKLCTMGPQGY